MRLQILAQVPLFDGLSELALDGIGQRMVSLSYAEGDRLYTAGDPADYLYVVAAGQVKTLQPVLNGQDSIVDMLAPGDFLGGLSVLGRPVYGETAVALVTTCALRIDTRAFREVLLEYPQVALRALDDVTALLRDARSDTSQRATSSVEQRVATTLLRLADKFGQHGGSGNGTLIQLPLSRADLAAMTGSTPESVSRAMSQLRKDGVVDTGRRWTSILDRDKLTAITETTE
ncbi:Crp/Fnr family transcriptional regulator [Salinibacterium sp. UTAS2018]|uniref:Crp/Fnr family transcriptional regulator n=1 Tax=Salinibacterium sp. UTAS2018 TaxID=2508880 RepID=UPI001009784F|nr:Crp/Fnr family transcriptional regulator [Salinibacterium sp. UTAS2018]QAV70993.1 Crp/Fnr family transcriptional regulator [Salinibacterium sp. UTAS2018]